MFSIFLNLGFDHIADFAGYDHILFLIAISIIYILKDIKKVLILITAFTIGHSLTLALAVLNIIKIPTEIIEFLIPVTIFISAIADIFYKGTQFSKKMSLFKYFSALFFGLIHGLGFSNYLKAILGEQENIVKPLLAFNIGLEIGQLFIVFFILAFSSFIVNKIKFLRRDYVLIMAGATGGISFMLMIERFPF